MSLALVVAGLALLGLGGEVLLRGAVSLATRLRLTPAVIGLTVVAAGTSVPELAGSTPALASSSRASGEPGVGSPRAAGLMVARVAVIGV